MSFDLYLDPSTNDIVYNSSGTFDPVTTTHELARQRLFVRLNTWMEEWFINTDFGVPYRQSILIKNITQAEIDAIFITKINNEELIEEISSYESELSRTDMEILS